MHFYGSEETREGYSEADDARKKGRTVPIICRSYLHSPCLFLSSYKFCHLQHNNADAIHLRLINLVVLIDTATQLRRPPVEKVEVQLSIARLELVVFEEQRVVEEGQRVEDVEAIFLGEDEGVVDERVQAGLEVCLDFVGGAGGESGFRGVVIEVGGADSFGGGGFEDGGLGEGCVSICLWRVVSLESVDTYCKKVVRDEVCNLAVLLDDVAPHDVFGRSGAEQVLDLGVCEFLLQVEAVEVAD